MAWSRTYIRWQGTPEPAGGAFGALPADHPAIGEPCPACDIAFAPGDVLTLVVLGPGEDRETRAKAVATRWYNATAIAAHFACATGRDPTAAEQR